MKQVPGDPALFSTLLLTAMSPLLFLHVPDHGDVPWMV